MKAWHVRYLDGLLSGLDDLPDGAWQSVCEDMIAGDSEFKGQDPFDVWMDWCVAKSKENAE